MTVLFWLTALAGGLGAALRLLADGAVRERWGSYLPYGTWVVNVVGSFVLGLLAGWAQRWLATEWLSVLGTGVMGGFTTFSTASVETVRLLQGRRHLAALGVAGGMLAAALIAAASGYWLGGQ